MQVAQKGRFDRPIKFIPRKPCFSDKGRDARKELRARYRSADRGSRERWPNPLWFLVLAAAQHFAVLSASWLNAES